MQGVESANAGLAYNVFRAPEDRFAEFDQFPMRTIGAHPRNNCGVTSFAKIAIRFTPE